MTTLGEQIAVGDQSVAVRAEVGVFNRAEAGAAVVVLDGVEIAMQPTQWPQPGDEVHVVCLAGKWIVLGPVAPRARTGRVMSTSSGSAIVEYPEGSGVSASLLTPTGMTLAVGDKVLVDWALGGVVVQRFGSQQETPTTPPTPLPPPPPQKAVFRAAWSGSVTDAGYWASSDVYSIVRGGGRGCWGYSAIKAAIPAGKTLSSARIYLPLQAEGSLVTLGYHTATSPSGPVALQGGVGGFDPQAGWQDVPPTLAMNLIGGGAGQGLCIEGGSGTVVAGKPKDGMSGALELTWV